MLYRKRVAVLVWLAMVAVYLPVQAEVDKEPRAAKAERRSPKFLRIRRDNEGRPLAMETAIVSYVSADGKNPGLTVNLVAAVHIGEKSYYDWLNEHFKSYDALLYELVAPEGTRIPKGGGSGGGGAIGAMQGGMKSVLDLSYQLECIDYTKDNFVHADMSPEEFARSMKERGESFVQIFLRAMGQGIAQQSKDPAGNSDIRLLAALFAKDRAMRLKRILAEQFEDLGGAMYAFEGPKGSTIINERNKKALAVLAKRIAAGNKKIGVFYGAGHLADMEKRLISEFGLRRTRERWIEAWKLAK